MWVVAVAAVIVVAAVVVGLALRRRKAASAKAAPASKIHQPPVPMLGLENALDQVTDRSGRNMREKIEGGTAIDDLRVPDDTGPVLRRALDHVEHVGESSTQATPAVQPDSPPS